MDHELHILHVQGKADSTWEVIHRGSWAGKVGKDWRKSPVTTQTITTSTCYGTPEVVTDFWQSLGFSLAYDVVKEGNACLCHCNGFGVDVIWTVVRILPHQTHSTRIWGHPYHVRTTNLVLQLDETMIRAQWRYIKTATMHAVLPNINSTTQYMEGQPVSGIRGLAG
jgi:hypothetical protein